jgi:hypothetical protein
LNVFPNGLVSKCILLYRELIALNVDNKSLVKIFDIG